MKGSTNNPNGRPKGTPNKLTAKTREKIAEALESGLETFADDLKQLAPKDRLNVLAKFAAFVVPKPKPEDDSDSLPLVVPEIIWRQPNEGNPPRIIWKSEKLAEEAANEIAEEDRI